MYFKQNQCSKSETFLDFLTSKSTATLGDGMSIYVKSYQKSNKVVHFWKLFSTFEFYTVKVYDG